MTVTQIQNEALVKKEIVAVVSLLDSIWPNEEKTVPQLVKAFPEVQRHCRVSYPGSTHESRRHVVWDGGELIAHALTFERPVISKNREISVMALARVCVTPVHRGKGIGADIIRSAFQRVDSGEFSVSLFQTTIPAFYERLGAVTVANQFVNSRNDVAPDTNPWSDEWIMIYPGDFPWPTGLIDLNGPGY